MLMRHQNIKFAILIIFLCFSIITGCTVLQGKSVKTYEAEYHDTVQASSDTLKNLKIPVIKEMSDELKTIIHAQRFDGTPVSIEVVRDRTGSHRGFCENGCRGSSGQKSFNANS